MTDYTPPIPAEADGADPDDKTVVRPRRTPAAPAAQAVPVVPVEPVAPVVAAAPVAPQAPVAPPTPYAAPQQQYRAPQPAKGLAVASMILGLGGLLLSFFGLGFLVNVAAVITGHLASKRQLHAKGFWLTGIITGYLGIAFSLVYGAIWANYFYLLLS